MMESSFSFFFKRTLCFSPVEKLQKEVKLAIRFYVCVMCRESAHVRTSFGKNFFFADRFELTQG